MKKGRKYYKDIIEKMYCAPSNNLSTEEIVDLDEYITENENNRYKYTKSLLIVSIIYVIFSLTYFFININGYVNILYDWSFVLVSLSYIIITCITATYNNRTLGLLNVKLTLDYIKDYRKSDIANYLKKFIREKNIDNILGS